MAIEEIFFDWVLEGDAQMTAYKRAIMPPVKSYSHATRFDDDITKVLDENQQNLDAILNRGIKFADNIDCVFVSFTSSATPDAENTVAHTLGKTPTGYIVYSKNKAGDIYDGTTAWTASNIYLKVNVASVAVNIIVF